MLKFFGCHFLTKLHPFFTWEGGKSKKVFWAYLLYLHYTSHQRIILPLYNAHQHNMNITFFIQYNIHITSSPVLYYKFYKHLTLIFHVQHIFVGGDGGGGGGDDDDIISCNVLCIFFRSDISVGLFQIVHTLGSSSPPTVKLQSHSDLPWSDRPTYVSDPNLLVINITSMQTLCISSQFLLQILQIIILESWCTN